MPRVYASGPISDQDYRGATNWYDVVEDALNPHIRLVKPMRGKEFLKGTRMTIGSLEGDNLYLSNNAILGRDRFDTLRCDAVLMNLLPATTVSIGCMFEAAWANVAHKPLVLTMLPGNPHYGHPMLMAAATYIVPVLEDAIEVLNTLFANG